MRASFLGGRAVMRVHSACVRHGPRPLVFCAGRPERRMSSIAARRAEPAGLLPPARGPLRGAFALRLCRLALGRVCPCVRRPVRRRGRRDRSCRVGASVALRRRGRWRALPRRMRRFERSGICPCRRLRRCSARAAGTRAACRGSPALSARSTAPAARWRRAVMVLPRRVLRPLCAPSSRVCHESPADFAPRPCRSRMAPCVRPVRRDNALGRLRVWVPGRGGVSCGGRSSPFARPRHPEHERAVWGGGGAQGGAARVGCLWPVRRRSGSDSPCRPRSVFGVVPPPLLLA